MTIVKRLQEEGGAFLPEGDEEDAAIRRVLTANQPPYRRQHGKGSEMCCLIRETHSSPSDMFS